MDSQLIKDCRKRKREINDSVEVATSPTSTLHSNSCDAHKLTPLSVPPKPSDLDISTAKHPPSHPQQFDDVNVHPDQLPPAPNRHSQFSNPGPWYNLVMNPQTNRSSPSTYGNSNVPGNIDHNIIAAAFHQTAPLSYDRLQIGSWTLTDGADSTTARKRLDIGGNETHVTYCKTPITNISVNPAISPVFPERRVMEFQRLGEGSKELATILVFLGGADVSESMLLRAREPRRFWNRDGEIKKIAALGLVPVLIDANKLTSAI